MNATEVRRRFLSLLDELPAEGILISKRGQPLARLMPVKRPRKGRLVTGPLLKGKGSLGPKYPKAENPYDLIFD